MYILVAYTTTMSAAMNDPSVIRRTAADEEADTKEALQNFEDQRWISWPNEGAVSWNPGQQENFCMATRHRTDRF